ncbi:unnamed protein product [Diamesa hyperborea]
MTSLKLAVRSGTGLEVYQHNNKTGSAVVPFQPFEGFTKDESKACKALIFSECGKFFAYGNGKEVKIMDEKFNCKISLQRPKAMFLKFSPSSTYIVVYEIFFTTKENPEGNPNLFIYMTKTGEEVFSFKMKRHSEWEPHFSHDESLFSLMLNGEVHFYVSEGTNGFSKTSKKLGGKTGGFSVSPGTCPHVAIYVKGAKGAPSMCRLFKYPNLETNPVASKSFFQADKVDMLWNKKGTGLLILTSTDVDQTGVSYYGKQALHFLSTNGNSFSVQLSADGPIHSVEWSPKSVEFIVVYGYMPAKATLFNLKCDAVFDFGTGIRNSIYFNEFGNMVLFGGFGNLRGNIEVWDLVQKKVISESVAPDTTLLAWAPTGDLYFTATTAPRLRMGNGFKVWHYSGALLFEMLWPDKEELLELAWQKHPDGSNKEPVISHTKVTGIQSSQPQASAKKYVPPNIRNFGEDTSTSTVPSIPGPIPGLPPGYTSSKTTNQRANNKNKAKKPATPTTANSVSADNQKQVKTEVVKKQPDTQWRTQQPTTPTATDSPKPLQIIDENEKKVKVIKKKLKDIRFLKDKVAKGEKLDKNQLCKVASETELIESLTALNVS